MPEKLIINITNDRTDKHPQFLEISWFDLIQKFKEPEIKRHSITTNKLLPEKASKDGPGWMPCSLKDPNGRRLRENIKEIFLLVLDIDSGVSFNQIEELLRNFEFVVHSTYSHSAEISKWRVILPLSKPIESTQLAPLFDGVNQLFKGALDVTCGHDPSRMYYLPSCPKETESLYVFQHNEGVYLDPDTFIVKQTTKSPTTSIVSKKAHVTKGVSVGERNTALTKLIGKYINEGVSIEKIESNCQSWNLSNTPPLEESEVINTVQSVWKTRLRKMEAKEIDVAEVISEMNEKYAWVEKYSSIYRFKFKDMISQDEMKKKYANTWISAPIKGSIKTVSYAEAWIQSPNRRDFIDLVFTPGAEPITDECINLWRGWGAESKPGDIEPWNMMLDHIFAEHGDMRKWFEQWGCLSNKTSRRKTKHCCSLMEFYSRRR